MVDRSRRRMLRKTAAGAAAGALIVACGDDPRVAELAEVSQQLSFESVDQLGPHHYIGSLKHEAERSDGSVDRTDEAVEIRWQDWNSFEYRRTVEGELDSAVVARDGTPWQLLSGGSWRKGTDAEPYRLELRQSWNAWDQALEPYLERIRYVDRGTELVEGRQARRYAVELAPVPTVSEDAPAKAGKRRRARAAKAKPKAADADRLVSLSGEVWVDESTAVRLLADVEASRVHRGRRHTVRLKVVRSDVGRDQKIKAPEAERPGRRRPVEASTEPSPAPPTPPSPEEPRP